MMHRTTVLLALVLLVTNSRAGVSQVQPSMQNLHQDLTHLAPFIFSEEKFLDAKNEKEIKKYLDLIQAHTGTALHHEIFKDNTFATVNLGILHTHLSRTQSTFKTNKKFARYMLQASMQMCITCHTSGFNTKSFYSNTSQELMKSLSSDFQRAEYLLTTRQFPRAFTLLASLVEKFPDNKLNPYQLGDALRYIAVYFTTILKDPKEAKVYFGGLKSNKKIPAFVMKDVESWMKSFENWDQQRLEASDIAGVKKMIGYSDSEALLSMSEDLYIERLRASRVLTLLLEKGAPAEQHPTILHLLGLVYQTMNKHVFFDLDIAYLKSCLDGYPQSKSAPKCYESMKEVITLNSTGSTGIHIEPEDRALLDLYKKKIKL